MQLWQIIVSSLIVYLLGGAVIAGLMIRGLIFRRAVHIMGKHVVGSGGVCYSDQQTENHRRQGCKIFGMLWPAFLLFYTVAFIGWHFLKYGIYHPVRLFATGWSLFSDWIGTPKPKKAKLPKAKVIP